MGIMVLLMHLYYYAYPLWQSMGLTHQMLARIFLKFRDGGLFDSPYFTKGFALALGISTTLVKNGGGVRAGWTAVCLVGISGLLMYFIPFQSPLVYSVCSAVGFLFTVYGMRMLVGRVTGYMKQKNDMRESFDQCSECIDTPYSVNLQTRYRYQSRNHRGWINVVNPFRGVLVLGTPGSGKSYSVYLPFIEQMICKGYTMFVYDYKYPALTYDVFNLLEINRHKYKDLGIKQPAFCVVNFGDPRYSLRCNPLNPQYIKSLTDCTEIADVLMKNLSHTDKKDFFTQSAQLFVDCCVSFLWTYENGRYCSFPHLVELMCRPAEHVIALISMYPEIKTKVASFREALEKNANEQLAGQTNSATVPMAGMSTPGLYWVLSGDDFSLDINNPDAPKIVCVGNDPDNQATYGAALALFFSRLFKLINHPGKLASAILLDEAPTVIIKGLDELIATARSNRVATVLGGQDKSQFIRDYGEKYANVIFNTVGTIISGQVNGTTARDLSASFGKEFRERRSQTLGEDSESIQISFSQEDIMPVSKIETLSQGTFFGKVADDYTARIEKKFFCGEILIDSKAVKGRKSKYKPLPRMTSFGEDTIRQRIIHGDMRDSALREYAVGVLGKRGIHDTVLQRDIDAVLEGLTENDRTEYLDAYADEYVARHIQKTIRDNYERIQNDIQKIMDSHGIGGGHGEKPVVRPGMYGDPSGGDDGFGGTVREEAEPDEVYHEEEWYVE